MSIPYSSAPGLQAPSAGEPLALRVASHRHHAWQSAMEQAQLSGWFKPGLDAGSSRELAGASALAPPPVARAPSGSVPGDGAGHGAQAPVPRSASSLAVAQALRVAVDIDQVPAGASAEPAGGLELGSESGPESRSERARGLYAPAMPAGPVAEGATLQLAALVWRQIGASIPEDMAQTLGSALQDEPVAPGSHAQQLRAPAAPVAAVVPATDAPPVAAGAGALAGRADAAAPAEDAFMGTSRTPRTATALPSGHAPDDQAAAAMRVHVAWSGQGASIWLGVNHERQVSLPALARQLDQWLLASGVKLVSLVCNGRTIPTRFSQRSCG